MSLFWKLLFYQLLSQVVSMQLRFILNLTTHTHGMIGLQQVTLKNHFFFNSFFQIFSKLFFNVSSKQIYSNSNFIDFAGTATYSHSYVRLVYSFYWTVATITSTGYGDVLPKSVAEIIYCCFVLTFGKIFIGYRVAGLAGLLANRKSLRRWYEIRVNVSKSSFIF